MKIKKLLRFYFFQQSLNDVLDGIILHIACASGQDFYRGGLDFADKIISLIEVKGELADLWQRLNSVICKLSERDIETLKRYAALRVGPHGEDKREIHRAAVKFTRRAGGIISDNSRVGKILGAYSCMIRP